MIRPPRRNTFGYLWLVIGSDAARYGNVWWKERGFWTTFSYRIRRARKLADAQRSLILLPIEVVVRLLCGFVSDAELPTSASLGTSLHLPHPQGVITGKGEPSGSANVTIFQQVTLGNWADEAPVIQSHVSVFAGREGDRRNHGRSAGLCGSECRRRPVRACLAHRPGRPGDLAAAQGGAGRSFGSGVSAGLAPEDCGVQYARIQSSLRFVP